MKQLLEQSKQQLLNPLGDARRKLLIILNITYIILVPVFLISEKIATGNFVNDSLLYLVYGTAVLFNLVSAIYNIKIFRSKNNVNRTSRNFIFKNQKKLDFFFGYASLLPILFMSFSNMMGLGNPFNDAILTDFALAQSLMIVVVIILGRKAVVVWLVIVVTVLFWNVASRGWNYEYHYSTPDEVVKYKEALDKNEPWALQRKAELEKATLNPPKISRYFNTWIVFIIVSFLVAYFFSGITLDIFKIVPTIVSNIERASEESKKMELEQKANVEKTNTFINLAHETKTPLTLINNSLDEYITKHGENEEILIVKRNIQKLTTDIVNFFDIERFNKGFDLYDHNQVSDFSTILADKVALFKSLANKKKINLHANVETDVFVQAHPGAVERVVNNLIENAIKYTAEGGGINVLLFAKEGLVHFSVLDNGIGIPKHAQQKVFEPYVQLEMERKSYDGMGMGLSIVKRIVDDLRGEIKLQSEVEAGTTLSVLLKQYFPGQNELYSEFSTSENLNLYFATTPIEDSINDPRKAYILIVEDNLNMLSYLTKKLKERYNVYVARNGAEAILKLHNITALDLIVSDIMMDTMGGFEFCQALSDNEKYNHIPFIFLTAKSTTDDKITGLKLGAIDYIEKPFIIDQLIHKIDSILTNLKKHRTAVITRAYKSILLEQQQTASDFSDQTFEDNCKRHGLTSRESEIIGLILKGQSHKMIGSTLNISTRTVDNHVSKIFAKVGVANKLELLNKLNASR